jgi:hypothetical protein
MYFPDIDDYLPWQHEPSFHALFPNDFPDMRTLKRHSIHLPGELREFVFSGETGHVFCFRLIDSDLDR